MLCRVPENRFDEWIAQRYETLWPELFDPAVLDPAVDFLADLAGAGPALNLASVLVVSRCRSAGGAFACTGSSCRLPWSRSCKRSRAPPRSV